MEPQYFEPLVDRGFFMKVLHVLPAVASVRGGPSHAVLAMVKALRAQGVEAEIATTNNNGLELLDVPLQECIDYKGVPARFFPQVSSPVENTSFSVGSDKAFIFAPELARWLWHHARDYDLLENHYLFSYASSCAGAIARWQKIPYIVRTIGQLSPWALAQSQLKKRLYSLLIERQNLNQAAAIHCTSDGEAEDVRHFGIQTQTFTLPLGVDLPQPQPDAKPQLHALYGIPPETSVLLFLSRIHPKKRPDLLLQVLHQLSLQALDCHLVLAGSGDAQYLEELTDLVDSLGLTSRVTFTGFVTGPDKTLLLQGSDLFVLPSYAENFGVAVAEAMAAGLPVIVTPGVQISPEIATSQAGLVIEGEVDLLVTGILHLLRSPHELRRLGENGRHLAQERYSWGAIAQTLTHIYDSVSSTTLG
jgi:glycosyltransferase involved in cell wall biosynthesis